MVACLLLRCITIERTNILDKIVCLIPLYRVWISIGYTFLEEKKEILILNAFKNEKIYKNY